MSVDAILKLLSQVIALAPTLASTLQEIKDLVGKVTNDLKQTKELTPEQEAALDQHIRDLEAQEWWQPSD